MTKTIQDQGSNWRTDGKLFLVRCYVCGRENAGGVVASGTCAWCGWKEDKQDAKD